jgi:protein-tyrosine phosphatase
MNDDLKRRVLPLENTHNFRDAGGYVTASGQRVRWGRLWRGESPHALNAAGHSSLQALGVRACVDLRSLGESEAQPSPYRDDTPVRLLTRPVFTRFRSEPPASQIDMYQRMLGERDNMRAIFASLAEHADAPLLVHCTAGKDRTGVVIALTHELLGVSREDRLADYLHTATLMDGGFYDGLRARARRDGMNLHLYEEFLKCVPETFNAFSDQVADLGGAEQYLISCGVSPQDVAALREALVA